MVKHTESAGSALGWRPTRIIEWVTRVHLPHCCFDPRFPYRMRRAHAARALLASRERAIPQHRDSLSVITLRDIASGAQLGMLTEEELAALVASLEEESVRDHDYYINHATIDLLEADGAPASLTDMLGLAMTGRDGMDIIWSRD